VKPTARDALRFGILLLACAILMGQLASIAARHEEWFGVNDFVEYWSAGQLLRRGQDPYDFEALYVVEKGVGWGKERPLAMWNPPWLLVIFYPLLLLPFGIAETMWFAISLGILLACAVLIWRLFVPAISSVESLVPLLLTLIFAPALFTLRMGQVSVLSLLGIAGFLYFESRSRDVLAGASLVLLTIKPHVVYVLWVAFLWWLVTQRRWKVLWGLGGGLLSLWALLFPLRPTWVLDYMAAARHPPLYWRVPVLGTVLRMMFGWHRTWLQYLPSLILCPLVLFGLHRRRRNFVWRNAIGPQLLLSVPTAAYGWSFDQLVLLVPYLQVGYWLTRGRHLRCRYRMAMAAVLPLINGLMLWSNPRLGDDLYLLWVPLAWSVFYIATQRILRPARFQTVSPAWCEEGT